jgi:glycopeptide antibiotics resistance protein
MPSDREGLASVRARPRLAPATVRAAAVAYGAALAAVTLLPVRYRPELARWPENRRPQLVPLWNLLVSLRDGDLRLATVAGCAGNVLLFVPLGFLLPLLAPRLDRLWRVVAVGAAVSVLLELAQLPMPGVRRADVNDVLMNALGAALGWLVLRLAGRGG